MHVLGLVFAGSATAKRAETAQFVERVLGLPRVSVEGADADMFALPDGSLFAVAGPREMGETSRSLGFHVPDLEDAIATLRDAGVDVGEVAENERFRYAHFRAPDGALYELVEVRAMGGAGLEPATPSL